jgi:sulfur carrier protein
VNGGGRPVVAAVLNGATTSFPSGTTVADVVEDLCPGGRGVAVAIDREVVPRSRWTDAVIEEGAVIEVVTAAAGG